MSVSGTTVTSMWRKTNASRTTGSSYSKADSTTSSQPASDANTTTGTTTDTHNTHHTRHTHAPSTRGPAGGSLRGGRARRPAGPGATPALGAAPTASSKAGSAFTGAVTKAGSSAGSAPGAGDGRTSVPSFWSIWTTRRMVRQLTSRLRTRRRPGEARRAAPGGVEPSYRLAPHHPFNSSQVEKVIGDVLEAHLHDFTYNAKRCNMLTRIIGEEIKDRVKALKFDRYKIVCAVTMGEKLGQDVSVASRCVWDGKLDTSSTYSWQNGTAFCTVTVYGIYHE